MSSMQRLGFTIRSNVTESDFHINVLVELRLSNLQEQSARGGGGVVRDFRRWLYSHASIAVAFSDLVIMNMLIAGTQDP